MRLLKSVCLLTRLWFQVNILTGIAKTLNERGGKDEGRRGKGELRNQM